MVSIDYGGIFWKVGDVANEYSPISQVYTLNNTAAASLIPLLTALNLTTVPSGSAYHISANENSKTYYYGAPSWVTSNLPPPPPVIAGISGWVKVIVYSQIVMDVRTLSPVPASGNSASFSIPIHIKFENYISADYYDAQGYVMVHRSAVAVVSQDYDRSIDFLIGS